MNIFGLLSVVERKQSGKIFIVVALMAIFEALGVVSIMPFLGILANPNLVDSDPYLQFFYQFTLNYGIRDKDGFFILLAFCVFILILFAGVYRVFAIYALNNFIEKLRASIGEKVFQSYLNRKYTFYTENNTSDLAKSVLSEVDNLAGTVLRPIYLMLANICSCMAIIILLAIINPLLLITTLGLLGGLYFFIYRIIRMKLQSLGRERLNANKKRFFWVNEAFSSIKILKLMRLEDTFSKEFKTPAKNFAKCVSLFATYNQVPKYLIEVLAFGGLLLTIIYLMYASGGLVTGDVGDVLPTLGLYAFATYRLQPALQAVFSGVASIRFGAEAVKKISDDLYHGETLLLKKDRPRIKILKGDKLSVNNISYTYPCATKPTLERVDLDIPIGSRIAMVGQTGSGKTTLMDILLGLLEPDEGAVLLRKPNQSVFELHDFSFSMGYVPQEVILTDSSVRENIAFGVPLNSISQKQIEYCAEVGQLKEFVENSLPEKYDTQIGERGVKLSGGQRQRIGIARALYHNPQIIIFDEATSALDFKTEELVMNAINSISNDITLLFVTHRLNTISHCDEVYALEEGNARKMEDAEFKKHHEDFKQR